MLDLITDRTQEDVAAYLAGDYTSKGGYRYTDLNRVGAALQELSAQLAEVGIYAPVTARTDWGRAGYPTPAVLAAYLTDVQTIRQAITPSDTTPSVPVRISASSAGKADGMDYAGANDIEQILLDVEDALVRLRDGWFCAGEICAGET